MLRSDFCNPLAEHSTGHVAAPQQFPVVWRVVRRAVLPDFPYSIFFVAADDGETVFVLAVLHHARNPKAWKSRV